MMPYYIFVLGKFLLVLVHTYVHTFIYVYEIQNSLLSLRCVYVHTYIDNELHTYVYTYVCMYGVYSIYVRTYVCTMYFLYVHMYDVYSIYVRMYVRVCKGHPGRVPFVICNQIVSLGGAKCVYKNYREELIWDLKLCPL